jgi:hypothetical protein
MPKHRRDNRKVYLIGKGKTPKALDQRALTHFRDYVGSDPGLQYWRHRTKGQDMMPLSKIKYL